MKENNRSNKYKAAICGHFGGGELFFDGQTVKTKNLAACLEEEFGSAAIVRIDTYGGVKRIAQYLCKLLVNARRSENVIILPAQNGIRILAPVLVLFNVFFHKKLHYVVIGGWLPQFLSKRKRLAELLKKFNGIYVETNTMKNALDAQGFQNVYVMPNCKKLTVLSEDELIYPSGEPYKLCTFSRVMKEKGIEDAVNAVRTVNERFGRTVYELDIYGQIALDQTEWFAALQRVFPVYIRYRGQVSPHKSVQTLKAYFALLFPTRFYTEGIPGTIIDAYASGIPVLAAKWESFDDLVDEGVTGIGYPMGDNQALISVLEQAANDPAILLGMKPACIQNALQYIPSEAVKILSRNL